MPEGGQISLIPGMDAGNAVSSRCFGRRKPAETRVKNRTRMYDFQTLTAPSKPHERLFKVLPYRGSFVLADRGGGHF